MNANSRVPENARNSREIEGLAVLGKDDGAAVEGQTHALQLSERRARGSAWISALGFGRSWPIALAFEATAERLIR